MKTIKRITVLCISILSTINLFSQTDTTLAYIKGFEKHKDYIVRQISYPPLAAEQGISGRVDISFIISEKGCIDSIKVVSSPDETLSKEVIEAVKKTKCKWIPAKTNGTPISITMHSFFEFKLE